MRMSTGFVLRWGWLLGVALMAPAALARRWCPAAASTLAPAGGQKPLAQW